MPRKNMLPFIKVDDKLRAILKTDKDMIETTEMIKGVWAYVKANNLKVPKVV